MDGFKGHRALQSKPGVFGNVKTNIPIISFVEYKHLNWRYGLHSVRYVTLWASTSAWVGLGAFRCLWVTGSVFEM